MASQSRSQAGFSLVEMMVALAISGFIVTSAAGIYLFSLSTYRGMQDRSSLSQDSLLLVDYMRAQLLGAGGGMVRSWMGIWVENDCAARLPVFPGCSGSDRLTISTSATPLQQCAVTAMAAPNVLQIAFSSPLVCCLTPQAGQVPYLNKQVMVTLNDFFTSKYATAVDAVTCRMTIAAGQASGGDAAGGTVNWTGATVTLMNVKTFYLDSLNRTLLRFTDTNNNNSVDVDELATVAIGVFDLQVALGYDFSPANGDVTVTANGVNDEWMYNAPGGVVEGMGLGVFVPPMNRSNLLLAAVGIILGVSSGATGGAVMNQQILNGPVRGVAGWVLQPEVAQLVPRNSYIFQ